MQKITLYILLSLLGISQTMAQSMALSLPQGTVKKTLQNGFTYIIMPNNNPKGRVEVRLCLKGRSRPRRKIGRRSSSLYRTFSL